MPENIFIGPIAENYDRAAADMFEPLLLDRTVSFLAEAAAGGAALEFGVGTGRVALPLSQRGVEVHGIDLSADMIRQLRAKPGAASIATAIGDFATTTDESSSSSGSPICGASRPERSPFPTT